MQPRPRAARTQTPRFPLPMRSQRTRTTRHICFLLRVIAIWLTAWTHDGDLLGVYPFYHTTWPRPMAVFTAAAGITHSLVAVV